MRLLLDTDICIYAANGNAVVLERLLSHRRTDLAISVITEAELRFGAANTSAPAKARRKVDAFLLPFTILDFTSVEAELYADLRARLQRAGTPIGPLDTLIAAHALAQKLVLVTNNERELKRVPGLKIENWSVT